MKLLCPALLIAFLAAAHVSSPLHGAAEGERTEPMVDVKRFPDHLQARIRELPPTAVVESVLEQTWQGTVYEVTAVDGRVLQIAENATLMNHARNGGAGSRLTLARTREAPLEEVPRMVREALVRHFGPGPVASIRQGRWSGPIYRVRYADRGRRGELHVTSEGTLMQFALGAGIEEAPPSPTPPADLTNLPRAVQQVLQQRLPSNAKPDIRGGRIDASQVFLVSFDGDQGRTTLLIDDGGEILNEQVRPLETALAAGPVAGAERVAIAELPSAVHSSLQQQAGPFQVVEVSRSLQEGRPMYRAVYLRERVVTDIRMEEDGSVIEVVRRAHGGGAPAAEARPAQASRQPRETVEVPLRVRQAVLVQAAPGEIAVVTPEIRSGRVLFRATFHSESGARELLLAGDGTIITREGGPAIREPAAAAPPSAGLNQLPPIVQQTLTGLGIQNIGSIQAVSGPEGIVIYEIQAGAGAAEGTIRVREDGYLME